MKTELDKIKQEMREHMILEYGEDEVFEIDTIGFTEKEAFDYVKKAYKKGIEVGKSQTSSCAFNEDFNHATKGCGKTWEHANNELQRCGDNTLCEECSQSKSKTKSEAKL